MEKHLSIIHLPKRTDRMESLIKEMAEQNITDWSIVEGVIDLAAVFRGISNAHKIPVRIAQEKQLSNTIIAEDDIKFLGKGAWNYFLDFLDKNEDYDLAMGMIYEGEIDGEGRIIKHPLSFSGMTLYSVSSRFYNVFLNINSMNHIDKSLGEVADKYKFIVCDKFVAKQLNGYSDQKKRDCKYDHYLIGRKLFGG